MLERRNKEKSASALWYKMMEDDQRVKIFLFEKEMSNFTKHFEKTAKKIKGFSFEDPVKPKMQHKVNQKSEYQHQVRPAVKYIDEDDPRLFERYSLEQKKQAIFSLIEQNHDDMQDDAFAGKLDLLKKQGGYDEVCTEANIMKRAENLVQQRMNNLKRTKKFKNRILISHRKTMSGGNLLSRDVLSPSHTDNLHVNSQRISNQTMKDKVSQERSYNVSKKFKGKVSELSRIPMSVRTNSHQIEPSLKIKGASTSHLYNNHMGRNRWMSSGLNNVSPDTTNLMKDTIIKEKSEIDGYKDRLEVFTNKLDRYRKVKKSDKKILLNALSLGRKFNKIQQMSQGEDPVRDILASFNKINNLIEENPTDRSKNRTKLNKRHSIGR